jgi:hypothetical protein
MIRPLRSPTFRLGTPQDFLVTANAPAIYDQSVMRAAASLTFHILPAFLRLLPALCWLLPTSYASGQISAKGQSGFRPAALFRRQETDLSGTYEGRAPAGDAARRVFTLSLAIDGTATFTTLYIGKGDATQRGRWTQNGNQIVLAFETLGQNRPPSPITFLHRDHELSPVQWDKSEWGRKGPPVLHRAAPKTMSSNRLSISQGGLYL